MHGTMNLKFEILLSKKTKFYGFDSLSLAKLNALTDKI
jgi:hypothetical protein